GLDQGLVGDVPAAVAGVDVVAEPQPGTLVDKDPQRVVHPGQQLLDPVPVLRDRAPHGIGWSGSSSAPAGSGSRAGPVCSGLRASIVLTHSATTVVISS